MVRIAVIGAGAWGKNLIRNAAQGSLAELVAVCDSDPTTRLAIARRYPQTTTFAALDEMLCQGGIDAVIIASPPHLHFQHASAVLDAGLHALVEKPLCTNSRDAAALVAKADQANRVLMVGHTFLYNNLVEDVRERIAAGEVGDVRYVYSQRLNLGRVRQDVDALWNLAPHDISIMNHLLGAMPTSVNARGACYVQPQRDLADVSFFQMDYPGGIMGSGHVSWLDPQKVRRMVVVGSERMLVYDDMDATRHIQVYDKSVAVDFQSPTSDFADFATRTRAGDLVIPNIRLREPLSAEIDHFATCVSEQRTPLTDGRHGLQLVCVLEALSRSMAASGASMLVDYQAGDAAGAPVRTAESTLAN